MTRRRDSDLSGQDSFQIIFDTYQDRQNGFIFGTTPLGVEYDAQVRMRATRRRAARRRWAAPTPVRAAA